MKFTISIRPSQWSQIIIFHYNENSNHTHYPSQLKLLNLSHLFLPYLKPSTFNLKLETYLILQATDWTDNNSIFPLIGKIAIGNKNHFERRFLHLCGVYLILQASQGRGTFPDERLTARLDFNQPGRRLLRAPAISSPANSCPNETSPVESSLI